MGAPTGTMLDALPDVDYLLSERTRLTKKVKALRARYGGNNNYLGERFFKAEEAKIDLIVRTELKAAGEKVTEPMVDAAIRRHPLYIQLLADELQRKNEWIETENELKNVEWRLEMRKSDSYLLGKEAGLQ